MASWRQAANAIQQLVAPALVGGSFPSTKVFLGWPDPDTIQKDLAGAQNKALVSIFPDAGSRLSSRYNLEPAIIKHNATETVALSSLQATIGGTITAGDNVFLYVNRFVVGVNVTSISTLNSIASALAVGINAAVGGVTATASGATVTVAGSVFSFSGAAFGQGDVLTEVSRITRRMMLSIWAAKPDEREAIGDKILQVLAQAEFLNYADSSKGRILFDGDVVSDAAGQLCIAKQDQFWAVEYPVFVTSKAARVGQIELTLIPMVSSAIASLPSDITGVLVITSGIAPSTGANHVHIWHEIPAGLRPGSTFTLIQAPRPGSEQGYLNGVELTRVSSSPSTGEYNIIGNVITTGQVVATTDVLEFHYEVSLSVAPTTGVAHAHVVQEPLAGSGTSFTLSSVPLAATDALTYNGVRLKRVIASPGLLEYSISAANIMLGFSKQADDTLIADYEI